MFQRLITSLATNIAPRSMNIAPLAAYLVLGLVFLG